MTSQGGTMMDEMEHQTERPEVALVPADRPSAIVRPVAGSRDVAEAFQEYRRLCDEILEDSDRMQIGKRAFIKRSGWRKLATAYGANLEVMPSNVVIERDESGRILRATVYARATAPNGRYADGVGVCDRFERCCQGEPCKMKHREGGHCRTEGKLCARAHFSNAEHDIPATASTRAMNRAASDLFGLGEVSAEEIEGRAVDEDAGAARAAPASPEQLVEIRDLIRWADMDEARIAESWGVTTLDDADFTEQRAATTIERLKAIIAERREAEESNQDAQATGGTDDNSSTAEVENPLL